MRYYLLYMTAFIVAVLSISSVHAQNVRFFDTLYDVPVMEGLVVLPEQAMSYDKPEGRISQSMAYMPQGDWEAISLFYKESLLQMGWEALEQDKYSRENELLEITHENEEELAHSGVIVRFLLRPQQGLNRY